MKIYTTFHFFTLFCSLFIDCGLQTILHLILHETYDNIYNFSLLSHHFGNLFRSMSTDRSIQIILHLSAGNRHKQNSWFCKEIREDNFRCWWRRVHEDASQGMYMSKIEIFFFTARILQNQRTLCCGECFHD